MNGHSAFVHRQSRRDCNSHLPCRQGDGCRWCGVLRIGRGGLGAIAMAGGSYKTPMFTIAWPTGEFGGMGLEGLVKLGYRNDLAAIENPEENRAKYEEMVARAYENGKALNYGSLFTVDDTLDPADSRW